VTIPDITIQVLSTKVTHSKTHSPM